MIENYENDTSLVVDNTELGHIINIFGCKNCTVQIKGKVNAVNLRMFASSFPLPG